MKFTFSSGYSAFGDYSRADRALLFSAVPYADLYNKKLDRLAMAKLIFPNIKIAPSSNQELVFTQLGGRKLKRQGALDLIETASIPAGGDPIGLTPDKSKCLGFQSGKFIVIPDLESVTVKNNDIAAEIFTFYERKWKILAETPDIKRALSSATQAR